MPATNNNKKTLMNYANIDKVIERFYSFLPFGRNFYTGTLDFQFEYKEQESILKFLKENFILIYWEGDFEQLIITKKGEDIVTIYGGIEKFIMHKQDEKFETLRAEKAKQEKIINDAKLSKWQVKTFWYFFWVSIIGAFFTFYNLINKVTEESLDKKVERIINNKTTLLKQNNTFSKKQSSTDTLSLEKADDK